MKFSILEDDSVEFKFTDSFDFKSSNATYLGEISISPLMAPTRVKDFF